MKKTLRSTVKHKPCEAFEEEWIEKRCRMMLEDCLIEGFVDGGITKESSFHDVKKFVKKFMYKHNLSREMPNDRMD